MPGKSRALYALMPDPDSAEAALGALERAGIERGRVTVVSAEPFDDYPFFASDRRTPMPWIAAAGGVVGGAAGYALAALTQRAYPLPTGGMPLVPNWTNGIITYEMAMLGAIFATVLTLLVSAGIPTTHRGLSDTEISDGKILVGVIGPPDNFRETIVKTLAASGAVAVKEITSAPPAPAQRSKEKGP